MPELLTYRRDQIPRDLAWQIRSYVRIQWPFLDAPQHAPFDASSQADEQMHFLLVDGGLLVTHASVNWRSIEHRGDSFSVFGLSTVFTYPAYRKGGHATRVVKAASDYIRTSQGDIAMLFCGPTLRDFYGKCGWQPADSARILFGQQLRPTLKNDNLVMMMFISEKGLAARKIFEKQDVYVGESTW